MLSFSQLRGFFSSWTQIAFTLKISFSEDKGGFVQRWVQNFRQINTVCGPLLRQHLSVWELVVFKKPWIHLFNTHSAILEWFSRWPINSSNLPSCVTNKIFGVGTKGHLTVFMAELLWEELWFYLYPHNVILQDFFQHFHLINYDPYLYCDFNVSSWKGTKLSLGILVLKPKELHEMIS